MTNTTEKVKAFSKEEVEFVEKLVADGNKLGFNEWVCDWETDWRESLVEGQLFWLGHEDEEFATRLAYLEKVVNEGVEDISDEEFEELNAELEFYKEEAEALMTCLDASTPETDFGKKLVKANESDRQNDVWRYFEEGIDEWLVENKFYESSCDWQVAGLPEPTYGTGTREDGSTFQWSRWEDWASQVEEDRLDFIRKVTVYLHSFDEKAGYGYGNNGYSCSDTVTEKRGKELVEFVKSRS